MNRGFSDLHISRWLEAYSERNVDLVTLPRNVVLADIAGDGNYHLVITDVKLNKGSHSRIRVYKGTFVTDITLPDVPNSIITFYTDQLEPRIPAVAVACGSDLYIHKNNKPYYKFRVPASPPAPLELDFWNELLDGDITEEKITEIIRKLSTMTYNLLTSKSQELLNIQRSTVVEFINKSDISHLFKISSITCMTTLKKNSHDKYAVSCPIIATESGNIYILDPQTLTVIHQANADRIKTTPFIIYATGIFSVEYRILIACREGNISLLKRGWLEGKSIIQITNIVDFLVIPEDNFIVVATTDKLLSCFTKRGHKLWCLNIINQITCVCLVPLHHISISLVAVGLRNGVIQFYHGRKLIDQTAMPEAPSVITFGQLGQEEHVLVIITLAGSIIFRILKRTADFNLNATENAPMLQSKPLPLPKRSKLFLEQNMRERATALDMHRNFQQDLIRLRLNSARALLECNRTQSDIINQKEQIKLSAQVLGLGPKFMAIFTLENMESNRTMKGISMVLHVKSSTYISSSNKVTIPLVQPSFSYKMKVDIEEVVTEYHPEEHRDSVIRVFIMRYGQLHPLLAATINMPPTEFPSI